jgi:hypothetical protein
VLENRTSKESLLELYLNRVYLGQEQGEPVYGIHHAAREYLEKEPVELTVSESATLAGLLLHPASTRLATNRARSGPQKRGSPVMLSREASPRRSTAGLVRSRSAFSRGWARQPMSRPLDWATEARVIRLPESHRPRPDTTAQEEG